VIRKTSLNPLDEICESLYVSVKDADVFIAEVHRKIAPRAF
jgi:hypothetical protein